MLAAIQAIVCHIEHSNEALLIGSNQWPSVPRMLLNWLLPSIHQLEHLARLPAEHSAHLQELLAWDYRTENR
jgi:hypothetical protein